MLFVSEPPPFGLPIAIYLFLAGIAAGAALCGSLFAFYKQPSFAKASTRSIITAIIAIGLGGVFLVLDLENPYQFWLILTHANPKSVISWGARIITIFGLLLAYSWMLQWSRTVEEIEKGTTKGQKALFSLMILFALAVAIYPAFVLRQAAARILWQANSLILLFFISGLHAGIATSALLAGKNEKQQHIGESSRFRFFEFIFLGLQLILLLSFLIEVYPKSPKRFMLLTQSTFSLWLWIGVFIGGWLLPLFLMFFRQKHYWFKLRNLLVIAGCFALRIWIVYGGQLNLIAQ